MLCLCLALLSVCTCFNTISSGRSWSSFSARQSRGASRSNDCRLPRVPNLSLRAIEEVEVSKEISNSFLTYAMSIISGRAIPDIRDGMKPVHRRILYAMHYDLKLYDSGPFRKSGRVVGEVLGKYHPHGDKAIYDSLVRMCQTFNTMHPLVLGHGNFGSVDGDPPAAMRYTETKLSKFMMDVIGDEIGTPRDDKGLYRANFDSTNMEPVILACKLPMLLLNGSSGIAVGMATNVPPHNLGEVVDGCGYLVRCKIQGKQPQWDELLKRIPAPDFPSGGMLCGKEGAEELYKTGRGGIIQRALCHVETSAGSRPRSSIVCTELPYQVNKSLLLSKIASMVNDKKIDGISDLRDESDRDGIRVVIELKKDAVPEVVQNNLYKKTPMQTSFGGNFLALMDNGNKPKRFNLMEAIQAFLDHRFETVRGNAKTDLVSVKGRIHVVEGLTKALDNLDHVIDTIRNSKSNRDSRDALMSSSGGFDGLTETQADSVIKLQLGQLNRLNSGKLRDEMKELEAQKDKLENIITDDNTVWEGMVKEMNALKDKYDKPRLSRIEEKVDELEAIDLIKNERSVIIMTLGGYVKRMPLSDFQSQQRGTRGKQGTSKSKSSSSSSSSASLDSSSLDSPSQNHINNDNIVDQCFSCNDHDTLIFSTLKGVAYGLRAFQIPTSGRMARGVPLPSVLPISADDKVTSVLPVPKFTSSEYIVLATKKGMIKKTPLAAFENLSSRGLKIATLEDGDSLRWCSKSTDDKEIFLASRNGMGIRYSASQLRPTARTSRGVRSMKLREGDEIANMSIMEKGENCYVLVVTEKGYGKRIPMGEFRSQGRGGLGVTAIKFKRNKEGEADDNLKCSTLVKDEDDVILVTKKGVIVRQKCDKIPVQGRSATGVMIQKVEVDKGDKISNVSRVIKREVLEEED